MNLEKSDYSMQGLIKVQSGVCMHTPLIKRMIFVVLILSFSHFVELLHKPTFSSSCVTLMNDTLRCSFIKLTDGEHNGFL
jgi:hypothetical protein